MKNFFATSPRPMARSLRVLARLLSYPDAPLRQHLPELQAALHQEQALGAARLAELDGLIAHLQRQAPLEAEADYVQLFDSGRRTALCLFEHVHGDSRERGPAMIDLVQTYEKGGLYLAEGEMPDDLRVLLEFCSTQPPKEAAGFLSEIAHLLNVIFSALAQRQSRYASVLGALLDLAGHPAEAVPIAAEEPLDESWQEPVAFDGCGSAGQRPGSSQTQPIHLVRRNAPRTGATP